MEKWQIVLSTTRPGWKLARNSSAYCRLLLSTAYECLFQCAEWGLLAWLLSGAAGTVRDKPC